MLKLYNTQVSPAEYWETWEDSNGTHTVHYGVVGQRGHTETYKSGLIKSAKKTIQALADQKTAEGFSEMSPDDMKIVLIEFGVYGHGSEGDLDKRQKLQDRMDETLGWTGLGNCDGGSIGSGTMEVCTFVVDAEIAKAVIVEDLKNTEFSDYLRIYEE